MNEDFTKETETILVYKFDDALTDSDIGHRFNQQRTDYPVAIKRMTYLSFGLGIVLVLLGVVTYISDRFNTDLYINLLYAVLSVLVAYMLLRPIHDSAPSSE